MKQLTQKLKGFLSTVGKKKLVVGKTCGANHRLGQYEA
jgi:hypothetical protein